VTLAERLLAIHESLERAGLPHAFGGAIALAYATLEPRGTRDLDVNVFVPVTETARVLEALPPGVSATDDDRRALEADGQRRLWWDDTPIDLFLNYAPIHDRAARHRRLVPFEGQDIPVLAPDELTVFKAMFDRTKDWADIEAMAEAGSLDRAAVRTELVRLVGADDPRVVRLDAL
jgi:hypothetical protein